MARFQVLAIVVLLILNSAFSPSFARAVSELDYADLTKLASLETTIFGTSHKNLPSEKRIDSLEKILFGKIEKGPFHTRIYALATAINGKHNDLLSPPVAPELDHSSPLGNDTQPPTAPPIATSDSADSLPPAEAQNDRVKTMLQEAMQLYGQGQTDRAEKIFKNVLKLDYQNPDANFNLGAIAEGRSDWQTALHYYKAAQKSNPSDEETQNAVNSMEAKIANGHQNTTRPSPANSQKLSPSQIATLKERVNQAASDYEKGNYDAAISNLKVVVAQAPDQPDVYYALGQAYKAKGLNREASAALNQAINLDPSNQQYKDALAEIASANGPSQNTGQDTFASNDPDQTYGQGQYKPKKNKAANNYGNNNLAQQNTDSSSDPVGQITPFSDDTSHQVGWQSAGTSYTGTSSYLPGLRGYVPSYTYSNSIPYSMSSRVSRAAIGSLAGAAIGSMFSSRGSRGGGAMTGAMVGGMLGLMGGHW